jgi:hypothetical protein
MRDLFWLISSLDTATPPAFTALLDASVMPPLRRQLTASTIYVDPKNSDRITTVAVLSTETG